MSQDQTLTVLLDRFAASLPVDRRMALEDISGSLAHTAMLETVHILSKDEAASIRAGLRTLAGRVRAGTFPFDVAAEDIHMNVEQALAKEIGPTAGKLHTGRSRNDQVALDVRLYLRARVLEIVEQLCAFERVLIETARRHLDVILPGYTHLQRAQPVLLAHHLLAYGWMFARDAERLIDGWKRLNVLPLGAGALAGTGFPLDRELVARLLAFDGVCENSMDAVSDRDFIVEFLAAAALCATHLSRLGEELILWSSAEFGFIELAKPFCTGSSIMPQKRNPDMAELGRGKTGRIYGALFGMLTVLKGLPLTYNKDLQECKEGMIDAADTLRDTLAVFTPMVETARFNAAGMRRAADLSYANATDLADYLAGRGIPFREAHGIVKRMVEAGISAGKLLEEFSLEELQAFTPVIGADVYQLLDTGAVVAARKTGGGTARDQVEAQIPRLEADVQGAERWRTEENGKVERALHELWEGEPS